MPREFRLVLKYLGCFDKCSTFQLKGSDLVAPLSHHKSILVVNTVGHAGGVSDAYLEVSEDGRCLDMDMKSFL